MSAVDDYRKRPAPDTPLEGAISMQYADAAIAELEEERTVWKEQSEALDLMYDGEKTLRERAEAELAEREAEITEARGRGDRAEAELAEREAEITEARGRGDRAEAESEEFSKQVSTYAEWNKNLQAELAALKDDLDWLIDTLDFNLQESGFAQKALDKRHAALSLRRGNALLEEQIRTRAEEGGST